MSKWYSEANLLRPSPDAAITVRTYASKEVQEIIHRGVRTHASRGNRSAGRDVVSGTLLPAKRRWRDVGGALGNIWGDWYFLDVSGSIDHYAGRTMVSEC